MITLVQLHSVRCGFKATASENVNPNDTCAYVQKMTRQRRHATNDMSTWVARALILKFIFVDNFTRFSDVQFSNKCDK